ncbi:hypothetical protein ESZ50_02645 [Weissella muntiaci]|uniref:Uncharacterized protein n=1 Tax=Weissella muntiaci TaxID=2508881 RepID=A0A6C2C9A9_9LACO|nr:type II toxin-antitoxin system YoeB family toxin [Weissella muntiaci]TYC50588.1 hypothetical protein ESZ50_02645 [Weissella muntiaci]
MELIWSKQAQKEMKAQKNGSAGKKIETILSEIMDNPFFQAEKLRFQKRKGGAIYSRKINWTDRLTYTFDKSAQTITLLAVSGHYSSVKN